MDTFLATQLTRLKGIYKPTDLTKCTKDLGHALLKNPWRSLEHKSKCVSIFDMAIRVQQRSANQLAALQDVCNEVPHTRLVSLNARGRSVNGNYLQGWCAICNSKTAWVCKTCRMPICKVRTECMAVHKVKPTMNRRSSTPRSTGAARSRSESPPDGQQGRNVRPRIADLPR